MNIEEIRKFLQLRNKRVRLEVTKFMGLDKFTFYVAGRDLHYFYRVIREMFPLGHYVEVRRLRVWECRLEKIQIIDRRDG